jgi:hypothetical protein
MPVRRPGFGRPTIVAVPFVVPYGYVSPVMVQEPPPSVADEYVSAPPPSAPSGPDMSPPPSTQPQQPPQPPPPEIVQPPPTPAPEPKDQSMGSHQDVSQDRTPGPDVYHWVDDEGVENYSTSVPPEYRKRAKKVGGQLSGVVWTNPPPGAH